LDIVWTSPVRRICRKIFRDKLSKDKIKQNPPVVERISKFYNLIVRKFLTKKPEGYYEK